MKQCKEVRDNVIHMVGHEHLVAVQLDLVLLDSHSLLDFREVENTCQVERIVHIQVDVEKRILIGRIQGLVEVHVILFLQVSRLACPERLHAVDDLVLVRIDIFSVLPLLFLAEHDRERHELTVFAEELFDFSLGSILRRVIIEIKRDDSSPVSLVTLAHLVLRAAVT